MKCSEAKENLSRYLDGELPAAQVAELERHLADCAACRADLERWRAWGKELANMNFSGDHDRKLDVFETSVYARLERGIAWILLSLGGVLVLASALFYAIRDVLLNPEIVWPLRAGLTLLSLALVILAVGVVRHRLSTYKSDKYKGVLR
ncbi:MAG TPA: zf-HC2 domain-containing protein [bacterium]|nr:zf-HC2 domain-containing protein [bacterium]